jgi:hypothetical protein
MKKSRWVLAVTMLTLFLPNNSSGSQEKADIAFTIFARAGTSENLVSQCKAVEHVDPTTKTAPAKDAMNVGLCFGFINGILDSDRLYSAVTKETPRYCVPDSVSASQAAKVVVKYGDNHPAELYLPAAAIVTSAMKEAFPCR